MSNVVEFVGGPWDGELRQVSTLDDIELMRMNSNPAKGPPAVFAGTYKRGTGAQRGKMLWREAVPIRYQATKEGE